MDQDLSILSYDELGQWLDVIARELRTRAKAAGLAVELKPEALCLMLCSGTVNEVAQTLQAM